MIRRPHVAALGRVHTVAGLAESRNKAGAHVRRHSIYVAQLAIAESDYRPTRTGATMVICYPIRARTTRRFTRLYTMYFVKNSLVNGETGRVVVS